MTRVDVGGHLGFACYMIDGNTGVGTAHSVDVLTIDDDGISAIVGFLDPSLVIRLGLPATRTDG